MTSPPAEGDELLDTPVVVHFGGATSRTTVGKMCVRLGLTAEQWREAVTGLEAAGWLTQLGDGSYMAGGQGREA